MFKRLERKRPNKFSRSQPARFIHSVSNGKPYFHSNGTKPHFLALGAIFHSELPFLVEWIEFHLNQGFEKFYLYDNEGNQIYHTILDPYIRKGQVVLHSWPDDPKQPDWTQRNAYHHCLLNYGKECHWLAFFDVDEFIFPDKKLTGHPTFVDLLKQFNNQNPRLAQLSIVRYNYGNYWHNTTPCVGGVVRNYLMRDNNFSNIKSVVKTDHIALHRAPVSVHHFNELVRHGETLDGQKVPLPVRFNHYLTKSTQDFNKRNALWKRKRETTLFNPPDLARFNQQLQPEQFNQVYDDSALEFLPNNLPLPFKT